MLLTLGSVAMFSAGLYSLGSSFSRSIVYDEVGLMDSDAFGARRVPWSAIAAIDTVKIELGAYRRFSQMRRSSGYGGKTIEVYKLREGAGHDLLTLGVDMVPDASFQELLKRIRAHVSRAADPSRGEASHTLPSNDAEPVATEALPSPQELHARMNRTNNDEVPRPMLVLMLLCALPCVLGTGYLGSRALWYSFVAERSTGTVVEVSDGEAPSLIVEYQPEGRDPLRVETAGSASYKGFKVGDPLSVMHDARDPAKARVDLFLENWLGTTIVGGISAVVLLTFFLIYRAWTAPLLGPS